MASFWLFLQSLWTVVMGKTVAFNVTSKKKEQRTAAHHVRPHIFIIGITLAGIVYNSVLIYNNTHPSFSGFVANCVWATFNLYQLNAFVRAAYWKGEDANS